MYKKQDRVRMGQCIPGWVSGERGNEERMGGRPSNWRAREQMAKKGHPESLRQGRQ